MEGYEQTGGGHEQSGGGHGQSGGGFEQPSGAVPVRSRGMLERMKGAAMLDVDTYEEVEADTTATAQAAGVVAIVAVAQAIGSIEAGVMAAVAGLVMAFVGWLIWAAVTYVVGDKMLGGTATWGELLRTLGFAQAPGVLYVLMIIPVLGWILGLGVGIWILVAGIIAIRQALDFSTGKAILTAVIGWFIMFAAMMVVGMLGAGAALF